MHFPNFTNQGDQMAMKMEPSRTVKKESVVKKENSVKQYSCWGCKTSYDDPAEFLWHIQNCSLAKK